MISHWRGKGPEPLAVVSGIRTPFAKAFGPLSKVSADELGRIAVEGVLARSGRKPTDVDEVVFGNVASPPKASNIARVIAIRAAIPADRIAHTVNRNCASGMESIISAWQVIEEGRAELIVAGGTESMSDIPLLWDRRLKNLIVDWRRQRRWQRKLALLTHFRPSYLKPTAALKEGLTDTTCDLNMGQTAEVLAREFSISREEQDRFSLESHRRSVEAWNRGFFEDEVLALTSEQTQAEALKKDTGPRPSQTFKALSRLRPVFDTDHGSITVGNSCPISDGAVALVLMSASRAKSLELEPLGYVRSYAIAGCQPRRMGLGPVFAVGKLLRQTGISLNDFDLVEINEAFASQVLACLKAMASDRFGQEELGGESALGELQLDRLNVNGGAVSLGHPVGATGTRLVLTLLRALRETGRQNGLATLCVGGGQGTAMWVQTSLDEKGVQS